MVRHKWLGLFLSVFLLVAACAAQSSSNFSGRWKLNIAKSNYGLMPAPNSRTDEIEQNGIHIRQHVIADGPEGKQTFTLWFTTDGKERTIPLDSLASHIGDFVLKKVSASWKGNTLAVSESLDNDGAEIEMKNIYELSGHGAILTIHSHATTPMGEIVRTLVFNRQGRPAIAKGRAN